MTYKLENTQQGAVLHIEGRLDTTSSSQLSEYIDTELCNFDPETCLTIDAKELEYISSSGLRVILALAKRFKNFCVNDASTDVYQVFEMTGFTKIINVNKALRHLSVDGCEIIGRGGVGTVYRIDGDTIIKVFREDTSIEEVQREISMAKEAFILGMPTAISFDIVKVGNQYGLVYELLKADTLSACIKKEPEKVDEFAYKYAQLLRRLHDIEVPQTSQIPSAKSIIDNAINNISRHFDTEAVDLMKTIADAIPDARRLLHCDLQTKNAMMQGDEPMLIDMGEIGFGHPIIDLGNTHSAMMKLVGDYEQLIGLPEELSHQTWRRMIDYYFNGLSNEEIKHRLEQIEIISCIRGVTWLSLSDSFPKEIIEQCRQTFHQRAIIRKDEIISLCQSLSDWTL